MSKVRSLDNHPERNPLARIALALSVLRHRRWCRECEPAVRQIIRALLGHRLSDIAEDHRPGTS